jgi:DeoR family glycerol-3-phosphate regulon repressor
MDAGLGYSTLNLAEAEINRAFIAAARRVVVLADHTKWALAASPRSRTSSGPTSS